MHAVLASRLHLKSPVVPPPEVPVPAAVGRSFAALGQLAGTHVLVVEDDADARELICALFEAAGATVLGAESVLEALDEVHHRFDPDVVLTDFSMPGADGLDLIREFRKAASTRAVAVPILVLSGHSEEHWRTRALTAGAADLLTKPVDPVVLVERINAAVLAAGSVGPPVGWA